MDEITFAARKFRKAMEAVRVCKRKKKTMLCSLCNGWKKCPKYERYCGRHHDLLNEINAYE